MSGLIAIVGRPNVGKSALFNRLAGRRIAIVHNRPGVTRDRITAEVEWQGHPFTLVDTGGIGLLRREKSDDVIVKAAIEQVELALQEASIILLVVDSQQGVVPLDKEVAARLRQRGKPVLVVVNKVDTYKAGLAFDEFTELGFERVFPVSAIHNEGIEPLMAATLELLLKATPDTPTLPAATSPADPAVGPAVVGADSSDEPGATAPTAPAAPTAPPQPLKIAIVGRPNVGKSSLINALTQSERVIVSPIPGTTRDAVDVPFEVVTDGVRQSYILIDTAGMRKTRRVQDEVEFFSVQRAEESIARCDIAVLVLDAESGLTEQDKKVAGKIIEHHKACLLVVNKWDLVAPQVEKTRAQELKRRQTRREFGRQNLTTLDEFGQWVQKQLFFLDYAPVIFTSAVSGFHLDRLLEAIRFLGAELQKTVPTSLLNRVIQQAVVRQQPISAQGHFLKFFYATQVRQAPPTFLIFVNRDELFSDAYRKYLANEIRRAFGYEGCPIVLVPKARPKTIESFRRPETQKSGRRPHRPDSREGKERKGQPRAGSPPRRRAK